MTHAEAYREMYGSVSSMMTVLQHRRAITQEALATTERLSKKLKEGFPPVDSVGASLNLKFETDLWMLSRRLKEVDDAIAECEPKAAARRKKSTTPAQAERQRNRRKK